MKTFSTVMTIGLAGVAALASTAATAGRVPAPAQGGWQDEGHAAIGGPTHLVTADEGNEARYRVREQLAGVDFPNDAVGITKGVRGVIVIDDEGKVVSEESWFVVDLTTLKSDKERRDGYVQHRLLETEQYPTAELIPTELRDLPWPLPSSGAASFELVGDLTVHGLTRSTTWKVNAEPVDNGFLGTATTKFTFDDFGLTKPRVAVVLSVEDEIQLELTFHLVPGSDPGR